MRALDVPSDARDDVIAFPFITMSVALHGIFLKWLRHSVCALEVDVVASDIVNARERSPPHIRLACFTRAFVTAAQAAPQAQREKQAHHHCSIPGISVDRPECYCGRSEAGQVPHFCDPFCSAELSFILFRGCPGHLPTASQLSPASTPSQPDACAAAHMPSPGWGGRGAIAESLRDSLQLAVDMDRKAAKAAAAARGSRREEFCKGVAVESLHASNTVRDQITR